MLINYKRTTYILTAAFMLLLVATMVVFVLILPARAAGAMIDIDASVAGGIGSGDSLTNAMPDLQTALAADTVGDEIWVATGVYTPGTYQTSSLVLPVSPLAAPTTVGNLRLSGLSPAINAVNNNFVSGAADLDGNPRILGGRVDIGVFKSTIPGSITLHKSADPAVGTAFDFASSLLFPDFNAVTQWSSYGSGPYSAPYGNATDSLGNVYVADSNNNRIQKYDNLGTLIAMWGKDVGGTGVDSCTSGCQVGTTGTDAG
jgi:hypothetical protein